MTSDKPLLLLRADASPAVGFGHFVRTCALTGYMRDHFECHIYSWNNGEKSMSPWAEAQARNAGAFLHILPASDRPGADRLFLQALEDSPSRPLTVLDNYYFGPEYQLEARKRSRVLICLDDMHDRHFVADLLISFVPVDASRYSMEPYTRYLSGFRWSFLREPFFRPIPLGHRDSIVLAMGGSDPCGLTNRLAPMLRKLIPDRTLEIIAGSSVSLDSSVDSLPKTIVHRNLDASEMVGVLDRAALGVFPASTLCVEAFARHVPVAAGYFVDNQRDFYATGVSRGLFIPLGDLRETNLSILEGRTDFPLPDNLPDFSSSRRELAEIFLSLL